MELKLPDQLTLGALRRKKGEPEKAGKAKAPKTVSSPRFVLFIGDEGTILVHMKGNVVLSRQFVPDASEQNLSELRATLESDPEAPVLMAIDSMDQTYIQQSLPPVSPMSVQKLIKRRLDRDFSKSDIKSALLLGRDTGGRKDWNFLMIALERTLQLTLWLDFVFDLPNRFQGIYLVSVETELVIKNLERAMGVPKTGTGSEWKFIVSHNKVGGFRQVILKNGRIIFTRLAQPVGESTPEVIAGNIEQEMLSTIEYMKRLAFEEDKGLDIYIIAAENVKPVIEPSKFKARNFHILTPFEVSNYLNIEGATQPTDQFGDVILAAAISSMPQHVLRFATPESRKFDTLYNVYRGQRALAGAVLAGMALYTATLCFDIIAGYNTAGNLEEEKALNQRNLDALRAEIKSSNLDVDRTGDIIDLYQLLQKKQYSPLEFIAKAGKILKPPIVIRSMEWEIDQKQIATSAQRPKMTAIFTLEFPGVATVEGFRVVSKKVLADLKELFPGYEVAYSKVPTRFSETEKLDMTFNEQEQQKAGQGEDGSEVQLRIKEM